MRFHLQNLNEDRIGNVIGSMFWRGRAWLYGNRKDRHDELVHVEWLFGKYAKDFAVTASFGYGESDAGICLHVCIPLVFSLYLIIPRVYRCKECQTGVAIHNGGIWFYPLSWTMESNSRDPWWRKSHSWSFPWTYDWYSTEVLEHKANLPGLANTVWGENKKNRRPFFDTYDERQAAQKSVSETYDYTYVRKSGEVQNRRAVVYVERMTRRMRWWPLLPFKKSSTSICVNFVDEDGKVAEVGEGTGSWKGGVTGCGYDMLHGETPLETLRRMERERKFSR